LASFLSLSLAQATDVQTADPKTGKVPPVAKPAAKETDEGCHGTAVRFLDSPSEAAKRAKKEEKLVFILHVSGNFEDPRYT
jgi:hypothetical protein